MKTPPKQNAISLESFKVVKCNYKVSPNVSTEMLKNLNIGFKFGTGFSKNESHKFIVKFMLTIKLPDEEKLSIAVDAQTFFLTQNAIDKEFKESSFANINAPAIAFPFLRSFIQTICVNAGISPIVLPPFNFAAAINVKRKE